MSKGMEMVYEGYGHIIDEETEKRTNLCEGCAVANINGLHKKDPSIEDVIATVEEIREVFDSITGSTEIVIYIRGVGSTKMYNKRSEEKDLLLLEEEDFKNFILAWESNKQGVITELLKRIPKEQLPKPQKKKTEEELRLLAGVREATKIIESINRTKLIYRLEEQNEFVQKLYTAIKQRNEDIKTYEPRYEKDNPKNLDNYKEFKFIYKDPITDKVVTGYLKRSQEVTKQHIRIVAGDILTVRQKRELKKALLSHRSSHKSEVEN